MNFARAIATVGGLTMLSRLAGFGRDLLSAAVLGAGPAADAFFVALKLPNLCRRLFAEGAFTLAFVPQFTEELEQRGRQAALGLADEALSVLLAATFALSALALAAMPWLMHVLAPGFAAAPTKFALAVTLARLTFPYLPLVSVVALLGGVLNALGRFGPLAAAPIAFNLTLIAALLLAWRLGLAPAPTLSAAVSLAGIVQVLALAWACRRADATIRLPRPRLSPRLFRLLRQLGPAALGAGIVQVNALVSLVLASLLPSGAVAHLYYADRLSQLPLGVIGMAIGTALLPLLARQLAAGAQAAASAQLNRAVELGLALSMPAAIGLALLAHPIVASLFGRGAFAAADTTATARALVAYAVGIPGYVLAKALGTACFARQDSRTPMRAAIAAAIASAVLGWSLSRWLGEAGIALASSLAAWLSALWLARAPAGRVRFAPDRRLCRRGPLLVLAALCLAGALMLAAPWAAPWLAAPGVGRYLALFVLIAGGGLVYLAAGQMLGAFSLAELRVLIGGANRAEPDTAA